MAPSSPIILVKKGEKMSKFFLNTLIIFIFFIVGSISFSSSGEISILTDFTPILKNEFIFDLKLKDIYEGNIHFDFELGEDYISVSEINEIVNYFKLYQPGFEISYRNPMDRKDPYFLVENNSGFMMILDDFVNLSFNGLNFGIVFTESFLTISYWNKLIDLSQSKVGITLSFPNNFGITFGFEEKLKYYFKAGDLLFSLNKRSLDSVYILNKDFRLEYHAENGKLIVNSIFFDKNEKNFYFRIPLNKSLYLTYSNLGFGVTFYFDLY